MKSSLSPLCESPYGDPPLMASAMVLKEFMGSELLAHAPTMIIVTRRARIPIACHQSLSDTRFHLLALAQSVIPPSKLFNICLGGADHSLHAFFILVSPCFRRITGSLPKEEISKERIFSEFFLEKFSHHYRNYSSQDHV